MINQRLYRQLSIIGFSGLSLTISLNTLATERDNQDVLSSKAENLEYLPQWSVIKDASITHEFIDPKNLNFQVVEEGVLTPQTHLQLLTTYPRRSPISTEAEPVPHPLDQTISQSALDLAEISPDIPNFSLTEIVQSSDPDTELINPIESEEAEPTTQGSSNLAQESQNPIANLISVPIQHNVNFNVGPFDKTQYLLNLQPVIPFELNDDLLLITRVIAPIINQPTAEFNINTGQLESTGSQFGLGDITPSFFFVPKTDSNVTWGVGPALLLPTATDAALGTEKWGAGPTGVVVITQGNWLYGVLASQVWSFAGDNDRPDVSLMLIQPFISYTWPSGWAVNVAPIITSNWNADADDQWTVPLGLTVSKLVKLGDQPVSFAVGGFYNVISPSFGPDWTLRFVSTFLFPTGG